MQSAYHSLHSTEIFLLKVQNDVLSALNEGSAVVLLVLDISAAFDTIIRSSCTVLELTFMLGSNHTCLI